MGQTRGEVPVSVLRPEEEPVLLPCFFEPHQDIAAGKPVSFHHHLDLVLLPDQRLKDPRVPDLHHSRTILSFRYGPLKFRILEWVVLGLNRKVPLPGLLRDPFRDGPRSEHALRLQPQVIMKVRCMMLLHDKDPGGAW